MRMMIDGIAHEMDNITGELTKVKLKCTKHLKEDFSSIGKNLSLNTIDYVKEVYQIYLKEAEKTFEACGILHTVDAEVVQAHIHAFDKTKAKKIKQSTIKHILSMEMTEKEIALYAVDSSFTKVDKEWAEKKWGNRKVVCSNPKTTEEKILKAIIENECKTIEGIEKFAKIRKGKGNKYFKENKGKSIEKVAGVYQPTTRVVYKFDTKEVRDTLDSINQMTYSEKTKNLRNGLVWIDKCIKKKRELKTTHRLSTVTYKTVNKIITGKKVKKIRGLQEDTYTIIDGVICTKKNNKPATNLIDLYGKRFKLPTYYKIA